MDSWYSSEHTPLGAGAADSMRLSKKKTIKKKPQNIKHKCNLEKSKIIWNYKIIPLLLTLILRSCRHKHKWEDSWTLMGIFF